MAKGASSKQAKSGQARGRGGSKREAVPGTREEALPAGDVATGAAGPSSNVELLQRLRRKQEVFSKLGGLVSTLQRQENIGQWRSKLEELEIGDPSRRAALALHGRGVEDYDTDLVPEADRETQGLQQSGQQWAPSYGKD